MCSYASRASTSSRKASCKSRTRESYPEPERGRGGGRRNQMRKTMITAITAGVLACASHAYAAEQWHQLVATGLGKQGAEMPGGVYRVGLPRTDLKVTLDGVEIKPGLALGSWLAFKQMGQ